LRTTVTDDVKGLQKYDIPFNLHQNLIMQMLNPSKADDDLMEEAKKIRSKFG